VRGFINRGVLTTDAVREKYSPAAPGEQVGSGSVPQYPASFSSDTIFSGDMYCERAESLSAHAALAINHISVHTQVNMKSYKEKR